MVKETYLMGKKIFPFESKEQFLFFLEGRKQILVALNAEKLNSNNAELNEIINKNIGYADGIGAVLALRRKGIHATKIAGAEFWLDIISKYHGSKSFYIIGSTPEVIQQTVGKLKMDFNGIKIKGYRDGFFKEGDQEKLIDDLVLTKPDIVFVAQGSPRQEILMNNLINQHKALYMGLGGSFDVYTGTKKRAPILFQKTGLEWLYRLIKEPTRISRQTSLLKFFIKIIFGKI